MVRCIVCKEVKTDFVIIDTGKGEGLCLDCYSFFREIEKNDNTADIIEKYYSDILPVVISIYKKRASDLKASHA